MAPLWTGMGFPPSTVTTLTTIFDALSALLLGVVTTAIALVGFIAVCKVLTEPKGLE